MHAIMLPQGGSTPQSTQETGLEPDTQDVMLYTPALALQMVRISYACAPETCTVPPWATSAMPAPFAASGATRRYMRVHSVSPLPRKTCKACIKVEQTQCQRRAAAWDPADERPRTRVNAIDNHG
jgi:hypothetical protein